MKELRSLILFSNVFSSLAMFICSAFVAFKFYKEPEWGYNQAFVFNLLVAGGIFFIITVILSLIYSTKYHRDSHEDILDDFIGKKSIM